MLPMGSIFFPLIVALFKTWWTLRLNKLYRSKVDFRYQHTKDVCPVIAYCATEFENVFHRLKFR